ncbi:MAG: hypothetical protein EBR82_71015 [Caulobacteraceae bacterium]|nr:hypothetical protein [Caulobacteraceae bacterium]
MSLSIPIISEFDGTGVKKAIAQFNDLEGAGAKAGFALKKAMVPAIAVLGGLAAGLGVATKAAVEDQKAQDLLANQLRTSAMATDDVIAQNENFITSMSMAKAVADDELRPAMANLVRSTGSVEVAQGLMSTALDIAAATGKDLETVTLALGKAANGQTAALTKLDPSLKGVIDSSSTLDEITAALSVSFGGAADVAAKSYEGRMKSLSIAMSETKESIGAALLPALEALLQVLQPLAVFAQQNTQVFLILVGVIGSVAAAVVAANIAMKIYQATLIATKLATIALNVVTSANPFVLVAAAVVALTAAMVFLEIKFSAMSRAFDMFGNAIIVVTGPLGILIGMLRKLDSLRESLGGFNLGGIKIPGFADGGIVTKPTLAMVGEKGPEAIVPLGKGIGGGGITVNVTGGISTSAQIGQAVYDSLLQYKQVYGPLGALA